MKILVLNGPNINFLGIREPELYGNQTYEALVSKIQAYCDKKGIDVSFFQSNHEGALIDEIQRAYYNGTCGIVINPAGYTHTSVAILDALKAVNIPTVEVHISRVEDREDFRKISYVRAACAKTISGHGLDGYIEAMDFLRNLNENKNQ